MLTLSFPLADAWNNANRDVKMPERRFWKVMGHAMGKDAVKEWEKSENLPDSIIKEIDMLVWQYVPGAMFVVFGGLSCLIFQLISDCSQLFVLILACQLLSNVLTRFKRRGGKPSLEENLLGSLSVIGRGSKGMCSLSLIVCGFSTSGMYIFLLYYYLPPVITSFVNFLYLLLILPPFVYQFAFWYAILERLPSFINCWGNGFSRGENLSLPTGGLYGFIASCVYTYIFFLFLEDINYNITFFFSNISDRSELICLTLLSLISLVYIALILYTVKKRRKRESTDDICKDNMRIPSAFFIHWMSSFSIYTAKIHPPIMGNLLLRFIIFIIIGVLCLIVFFVPDWWRFLESRYLNLNLLAKAVLKFLPGFVLILLGYSLAFGIKGKIFTVVVPAYLIVCTLITFLAIYTTYRKEQLHKAQESCKANNINHNEEKK